MKPKITPFKLKPALQKHNVSEMFSFAQLEMAFEAGRQFEGHCDKVGNVQGMTKEEWDTNVNVYCKYASFAHWAKENLR